MGSGASQPSGKKGHHHRPATVVADNGTFTFRYGAPAVEFNEAFGCFKWVGYKAGVSKDGSLSNTTTTSKPGFLFRLVDTVTGQWYFHNDTTSYYFVVTGYFRTSNAIRPLKPTKMYLEMPSNCAVAEVIVGPLETVPFIEGAVDHGHSLKYLALSQADRDTFASAMHDPAAVKALVEGRAVPQLTTITSGGSVSPQSLTTPSLHRTVSFGQTSQGLATTRDGTPASAEASSRSPTPPACHAAATSSAGTRLSVPVSSSGERECSTPFKEDQRAVPSSIKC